MENEKKIGRESAVDLGDRRLYSKKDLYLLYRRRYITEKKLVIPDITDERFSGSLRY